ncbi:MAG TPA: valine--tRNA ligase [Spirochaetia bacterium]|nr:valine--tRNA ligase [Spirochaetales bacterium]HPD79836.1 valine--tRNA ligase [Spirochaetales bacterium]HQK33383.1 valine--tRNA ligase [Spirochaetales bacterium]HRS65248.1 valine--tRNA ligase [Spirochaetia bacterium]
MKSVELPKAYDPKTFEEAIYKRWLDNRCFMPIQKQGVKPFVIVIPPPNVTGVLHMGHGLNNSLQDILIRYHRMKGEPTLWVPGADHAGIATQHVVEKKLRAQGIDKREIGREAFLKETWKVKEEHHEIIKKQLQKLGSSCDWSRERFTLDEGLSKAVREVFVSLYEKGYIYRGKYLVNWCPSCGTALADDEVEHDDEQGALHYIKYPFADGSGYIEIATTRPETMLGDTAVACNPDDERYKHLVGKQLVLPLTGRTIPLIADSYVDKEFGTGLVKITPAHDPNDFEVGNRHSLEKINILTPDGRLNENVPEKYRGMTVKDGRKAVIEDLQAQGFYIEAKPISHSVGHCYRCHTVVEPFLSEQWFVKMKPLAEKALSAWRDGTVRFFPERWEHTYENWLVNIRDWCISRQLWWGHRIPVWYCDHCGEIIVAREEPLSCPRCKSTELRQDEDVLDTWFSSWLWPFSVFGWPQETSDLRHFYPTTTLVTGYDIIFFWVARMIMAGMEFTGKAPFRDICITTLVRDKQGRKMSKSLGNGIDPLEIIDEYGADALRFTLSFMFTPGQDILINKDDFKLGSKFSNKVWNATRYILMNLDGCELVEKPDYRPLDKWIRHRLNETAKSIADALAVYRFNDASRALYEFFWNDFCDWYVEASKIYTRSTDQQERNRAVSVLLEMLETSLRLLHPFLPFITEELYSHLPNSRGIIMIQEYPQFSVEYKADSDAAAMDALMDAVTRIRTLRSEFGISPEKKIKVSLKITDRMVESFIKEMEPVIALLVNAEAVQWVSAKPEHSVALAANKAEIYIDTTVSIDIKVLQQKLQKQLEQELTFIEKGNKKLGNADFVDRAPQEVITAEKEKLAHAQELVQRLRSYLEDLSQE